MSIYRMKYVANRSRHVTTTMKTTQDLYFRSMCDDPVDNKYDGDVQKGKLFVFVGDSTSSSRPIDHELKCFLLLVVMFCHLVLYHACMYCGLAYSPPLCQNKATGTQKPCCSSCGCPPFSVIFIKMKPRWSFRNWQIVSLKCHDMTAIYSSL